MKRSHSQEGSIKEKTLMESKEVHRKPETVASLVGISTDLFRSASDTHSVLKRKLHAAKEKFTDKQHRGLFHGDKDSSSASSSDSSHSDSNSESATRKRHRSKSKAREGDNNSDDRSIDTYTASLRGEYERGHKRFGEKYATGDLLALAQLQTQIIAMQQVLLRIHLHASHHTIIEQLSQIRQTAQSTRTACSKALSDLYHRLIRETEMPKVPGAFPVTTNISNEVIVRTTVQNGRRSKRRELGQGLTTSRSLFCLYAMELQKHVNQPLASSCGKGDNICCVHCMSHLDIRPGRAWEIVLPDPRCKDKDKVFLLGDRFLVKCHREGGGFACVLCSKFKDYDTVMVQVGDLVHHIWKEHEAEEVEDDEDVRLAK